MRYFFLILIASFFISCAPSISEVWLNKDGSGKMESTFDLGEMAAMFEGMMDQGKEKGNDIANKPRERESKDTIMNFYDIMPDSVKQQLERPELLKNMVMEMRIDDTNEDMYMKMGISYKNEQELNDIFLELAKAKQDGSSANPMLGMASDDDMNMLVVDYKLDRDNRVIRMPQVNMLEEMKNSPEMPENFKMKLDSMEMIFKEMGDAEVDPEVLSFLEMFIGQGSKTIVHAPGDILFTNKINAVVNKNTVTFTSNVLEDLKKGKEPDFSDFIIKYK